MVTSTRKASLSPENVSKTFIDQKLLVNPDPCTFYDDDIDRLKSGEVFPPGTEFRPFDESVHADFCSTQWVCFPETPFLLGLKYPFPPLISEFFSVTKLSYVQAMPMVWRILTMVQRLVDTHGLEFGLSELAAVYTIRGHGPGYFLFQVKSNTPHLILKTTSNDTKWKSRFFFVKRDSIPGGENLHSTWAPKVKFSDLAPPEDQTEARIALFLEIPESERTFFLPGHRSESTGSIEVEPAMSGSQKSFFNLDEIDKIAKVKAEKEPDSVTKPRIPNLRSKAASATKKRKGVVDVDDAPDFDQARATLLQVS